MVAGLSLLPADSELAGAEIELVSYERREFLLRQALSDEPTASLIHDYVLLDCPPSLGLLTLNALVAAHSVLVPLQCEFFALEGVSHVIRTIDRVRKAFNPGLRLQGLVLTMFDKRNNLSELVADDARGFFGDQVFGTLIPRNVRISEAQATASRRCFMIRAPAARWHTRGWPRSSSNAFAAPPVNSLDNDKKTRPCTVSPRARSGRPPGRSIACLQRRVWRASAIDADAAG